MQAEAWLLLIHQIPAKPLYLRARFRRLLAQSGAVALKPSVYALPKTDAHLERLQEVADDVRRRGGESFVCETRFPDRGDHTALVEAFRRERSGDYGRVVAGARAAIGALEGTPAGEAVDPGRRKALARLRRELTRATSVDFFAASGRAAAEAAVRDFERAVARPPEAARRGERTSVWVGRTWVTRQGVHVDRIACAWFIRRFLDKGARFRFVASGGSARRPGEIGFDMPGAEFTHEGDRCSIETLIAGTGPDDPALVRIAGIVHDLDFKDGKFGHPETAGIERLLGGILAAHADDRERLARGATLFDDLYRAFSQRPSVSVPRGVSALRRPRSPGQGGRP